MKLITLLGCLLLLTVLTSAANTTESYEHSRNLGNFSETIQAENIGKDPSQYFICKISLRQTLWKVVLYNCNCKTRWYKRRRRFRCNHCVNDFWTQNNAIKVTMCSYADWNKQIEKVVETGKKDSRNWIEIACPKGQYAYKIATRFGAQHGTDTGLIGFQITCASINYAETSVVEGNYRDFPLNEISKNRQGTFISTFNVKYLKDGYLTGIRFGFEPMPIILRVTVTYDPIMKLDPTDVIIDTVTVTNNASKDVQQAIGFTKGYMIENQWTTQNSTTSGYEMSASVSVNTPAFDTQMTYTTYKSTTSAYGFNKAVQTKYESTQQTLLIVPAGKIVEVQSVIKQQTINVPFTAVLQFGDRFDNKPIGNMTVKGVLIGVMASSVNTIINQRDIPVVTQAAIVQNNNLSATPTQTNTTPAPAPTQTPTQTPAPTQSSTEQSGSNLRS